MPKTLNNTYLFHQYSKYEKDIFQFIVNGEKIDTETEAFEDILYEIKRRQISDALSKLIRSENVILIINSIPLTKSFKVFAAKDIKSDKKLKVFIDVTNLIELSNGKYVCHNVDVLVAYLVSAATTLIYYADTKRIDMNTNIIVDGAYCFSSLYTHIVDYICKISTVSSAKAYCLYLSAYYYLTNILDKDDTDSIRNTARKISAISEREEDIIRSQLKPESFDNIKFFTQTVSDILRLNKLSFDLFIEKWMYIFGPGTIFSVELFPSFASMITDTYVGCYINNQKTIEKVVGGHMVEFTKAILRIISESV